MSTSTTQGAPAVRYRRLRRNERIREGDEQNYTGNSTAKDVQSPKSAGGWLQLDSFVGQTVGHLIDCGSQLTFRRPLASQDAPHPASTKRVKPARQRKES